MKKISFLTIFFILLGICQVNAQTIQKTRPYLGLYGAIALPTGDFGNDDASEEKSGLAKTGFGVGIDYTFPLSSPGLSWISNISIILNGFDDDAMKDFYEEDVSDVNVDAGYWINVPVMTGIKYQSKSSSNMSYYGTVQAGLNFIQGPTVEVTGIISEDYGKKDKITYKMDMATTFGISIGGGIIFNDKFTVGLRYLMLGNPDIKIKTKSTEEGISYTDEYEKDQPISIFLLTVGMRL